MSVCVIPPVCHSCMCSLPTTVQCRITSVIASSCGITFICVSAMKRSRFPSWSRPTPATCAGGNTQDTPSAPRAAPPSRARRAHQSPLTARLSDSVPPEVNTTAEGRVRRSSAMDSRACSTMLRAARPDACKDDGLPATAEASSQASRAWGSSGVVAAWSTKCRAEPCTAPPAEARGRVPALAPPGIQL